MGIIKNKNLKLIYLIALALFSSVFLISCGRSELPPRICCNLIKRPRIIIKKYESPFSIRYFGRDLAFLIREKRVIYFDSIKIKTEDNTLTDKIEGILRTTIVKMKSSPVAMKYFTTFTGINKELDNLQIEGLNITGSISEADKILSTPKTFYLDATFGKEKDKLNTIVNIDKSKIDKVFTINFHAKYIKEKRVIPLPIGYAKNTAVLFKKNEDGYFNVYILGDEISIGGTKNAINSQTYALGLLTEFSLTQLLGRVYKVPYWHCVKTKNKDKVLYQYMEKEWKTLPTYPKGNQNYRDSKLGRYSDIARLFYNYYISKDVKKGKVYSYSEKGKKFPRIAFLRGEKKVITITETNEDGKGKKVKKEIVIKKVNKENVEKFIKVLMKFYNIEGDMYSFDTYFRLLNEAPFCGYPYNKDLKDYLLTELVNLRFVAYPNDIIDPIILYYEFLEKRKKIILYEEILNKQ